VRRLRVVARGNDGLAEGALVGPYEIVALVGAGGMGEVYRARDERIGRDVAIKVLPPKFATDRERLRRFAQGRPTACSTHGLAGPLGDHCLEWMTWPIGLFVGYSLSNGALNENRSASRSDALV
jgi:serine/threonine protein kinase